MKNLKTLFEQTVKASTKFHNLKRELDRRVIERWGCHYSDFDDDFLIDTTDYATSNASFEHLVKRMDEYQKREDE